MIDFSNRGLAYFANNDGVLEFDGEKWRKHLIQGGVVVRSVKAADDGRVYAGGFNEFGYFSPDNTGNLIYHSLCNLIPTLQSDFGEVWKIYDLPVGLVFQSYEQLMIYKDNKIRIVRAPQMFHFSFLVNDELFINDQTKGLYRLANDRLVKVPGADRLAGQLIWAMLPKDNHILIATADRGIFEFNGLELKPWQNPASELLIKNQIYCGLAIDESTYAFGTIQDGLVICDTSGTILQHINLDKGLQNNTVLSLKLDQYENLWLGLDQGIDYVEINSPLTYFSYSNQLSAGYTALLQEGLLYLGTNRGVFYHDWQKLQNGCMEQDFKLVAGTQGQVWNLTQVDETLFCGHNSGIYIIDDKEARLISDIQGGWTFITVDENPNILICGTYTNLVKFEKKNGIWQQGEPIRGFSESSRFLAKAGRQKLWMAHGYKGVFRIHFNQSYDSVTHVDFFDHNMGFPTDKNIAVFEIFGEPVFTTDNGFYRYDIRSNRFVADQKMKTLFPDDGIRILHQDQYDNIWYFTLNRTGVFRLQEDGSYVNLDVPFRELSGKFIKWFQFVYPMDEKNVIFGTQDGFVHYTPEYPKNYQKPSTAFIRQVVLSGVDSVIFAGGEQAKAIRYEIPFRLNQLRFEYAANDFENPQNLQYTTKLTGFDQDWTAWQNEALREFTNLAHGNYNFQVKARDIFGYESSTASFEFYIAPPWHLRWWAYALYLVLFVMLVILMSRYVNYRMKKSKVQEEERQKRLFKDREKQLQTEALEAEKEVIRLRNAKLRAEMKQKDKELANSTMQMIQKSKSLNSIKRDLGKLSKEIGDDLIASHIHSMTRKINREMDTEQQWEIFEKHFENVHEEFLKRLKGEYPELSPREMKLCAYLRLNISSKEIASLMNISTRGVEISRYRLRKKLRLEHDANLTEFILSI
jgi:DNA-binding CsgD family transcriptional regulator